MLIFTKDLFQQNLAGELLPFLKLIPKKETMKNLKAKEVLGQLLQT